MHFTATFPKLGYLRRKIILEKAKVNYSCVSIVQASDLKERLKYLKIKRDGLTIASVDAVNIYPSLKFSSIRKAVRFFLRKLNAASKKTINPLLELILFGKITNLISFNGEYYEYHSGEKKEQGLSIGGYELAFLAKLVAYYLLKIQVPSELDNLPRHIL